MLAPLNVWVPPPILTRLTMLPVPLAISPENEPLLPVFPIVTVVTPPPLKLPIITPVPFSAPIWNAPEAGLAQPMPWFSSSMVPLRVMLAVCRAVVQPPTPMPLPTPVVVLAMPFTTKVPVKVELLLRMFTPTRAVLALIVTVPVPARPPSRYKPASLMPDRAVVLIVVLPLVVTPPSNTAQAEPELLVA